MGYDQKCLNYNHDTGKAYMQSCHTLNIQKWEFEGADGLVRSVYDKKCLEYGSHTHEVQVSDCNPTLAAQQWTFSSQDTSSSTSTTTTAVFLPDKGGAKQVYSVGGAMCLDDNFKSANAYVHGCHAGANQRWYFDGEQRLRSLSDQKCLDYNYVAGNAYMHDCHPGTNQKWEFEGAGKRFRSVHDKEKCLDYDSKSHDVRVLACDSVKASQQWEFPESPAGPPSPQGFLSPQQR